MVSPKPCKESSEDGTGRRGKGILLKTQIVDFTGVAVTGAFDLDTSTGSSGICIRYLSPESSF